MTRQRIFWMGMHKVLKPTELRFLREMGYEVFNPPYISPVYDQSADLRIDSDQPTTLPPEIFAKLMATDFFYRPIDPDVAQLLNDYFDTLIVTISAHWLKEVLKVFDGPIVYRIYGQHFSLSDLIIEIGAWPLIESRGNFHIVPFAAESIVDEHHWFRHRISAIVPYQIPDELFEMHKRWDGGSRSEIMVNIPNVQNPYFARAYSDFSSRFPERFFGIYGPQRNHPEDPRFVGKLSRGDFLNRLLSCSAYYYDYRDQVCYLPPIEAMQLGIPVVCAAGSLLAAFLGDGPNVMADEEETRSTLKRLVRGDPALASALIANQELARQRYDRALVKPGFVEAFSKLLGDPASRPSRLATSLEKPTTPPRLRWIAICMHWDGLLVRHNGKVLAFEGIPRVIDSVVRAICEASTVGCLISCTPDSFYLAHDFFFDQIRSGAVRLHIVGSPDDSSDMDKLNSRIAFAKFLDESEEITSILVPHYYLFPEILRCSKRTTLYLPDYFPHLQPDAVFDVSAAKDAQNKAIGVMHAQRASAVLTNSNFTKRYLPDAGFIEVDSLDKVVVMPLPFLGDGRATGLSRDEQRLVERRLGKRPFIFYPTANRPNKQLAFLLDLYADLLLTEPTLALVLTGSLGSYPPALERARTLGLVENVTFIHHASEGVLRWLYANADLLCLTSTLEGNFSPQVLEALNYDCPVVATRLETMTEVLGEAADGILFCNPLDHDDFKTKIRIAITDRAGVLERQAHARERLREWNSAPRFLASLQQAFPEMVAGS